MLICENQNIRDETERLIEPNVIITDHTTGQVAEPTSDKAEQTSQQEFLPPPRLSKQSKGGGGVIGRALEHRSWIITNIQP